MSGGDSWLAAHLFYAEPHRRILTEAVYPFIERMSAVGAGEQFFFIRYWERGPHIRLRLKGDRQFLTQMAQPELAAFFTRYLEENPSERTDPKGMVTLPVARQWLPNNSIHFFPYEPEVERYGGPVGIAIAERQFQLSSQTTLRLLSSSEDWNYDRALGAAIQMHLGLAWALGMTLKEARQFYNRVFSGWFFHAYGFSPNLSEEDIRDSQQAAMAAFAETFERQQDALVAYCRQFWQALNDGLEFEQVWLNGWLQGMQKIGDDLKTADAQNQIIYPPDYTPDPAIPVSIKKQNLWSILGSYVHMTNNRLGILNRDEAFLGYLIVKSLEKLE